MGRYWLFEETKINNSNSKLVFHPEANRIPYDYWGTATEYPSNPLEGIKEKLESIICLAAEGPEVESHAKLFEAIIREASKALNILEGK